MLVHRFNLLIYHLGVNLGGGDIAVSHQLLQGAQISTVFQKMNRKAVAQSMGGNILLNMGFLLIELQNLPESLTADSLAAHVYKPVSLYPSDAADEGLGVVLCGRRVLKHKHRIGRWSCELSREQSLLIIYTSIC